MDDMRRADASQRQRTILHAFPTFEVGGSQIRFAALANHHGARYRHLIVAMDGKTQCLDRLQAQVPRELLSIDVPKNRTLGNFMTLRRQLATLRPDVLVTYNWGAIEWALANILPLCAHVHIEDGFGPEEAGSGQLRRRSLFRRLVLSHRSRVVLPSQTLLGIARGSWRLPERRLNYVPNGIDCARFMTPPDAARAVTLRRTPGEMLIGTVATLRAEKNLGRLLEAFAKLPPDLGARLIIVGGGAERERLEARAAELAVGDGVLFTGPLNDPEKILGAFDLFALSSDTEQMPFSILEAMAAGLPIASVEVGDVRNMLSPENQPFIAQKTADSLAEAMMRFLKDAKLRQAVGRSNQEHVRRHYDQSAMFQRYAELFDA